MLRSITDNLVGIIFSVLIALTVGWGMYQYGQFTGKQDLKEELHRQEIEDYNNVRKKVDRIPKPRGGDDARRVLQEYLDKR